jgi:hypothetical protein
VTSTSINGGPVYAFDFSVAANVAYNIDPAIASGFVYATGAGNPNFASVELPSIGNPNPYELRVWNGASFVFEASLSADTVFDFGPGGVQEFEVLGISPGLGLDPLDSTDFVTRVTYEGTGTFTGTMTPIAAPESSTWVMMLLGFAGLGWASYRSSRRTTAAPAV